MIEAPIIYAIFDNGDDNNVVFFAWRPYDRLLLE